MSGRFTGFLRKRVNKNINSGLKTVRLNNNEQSST